VRSRLLHLSPWCEMIGRFRGLSMDDQRVYVKIDGTILAFALGSKEAEVILEKLGGCSPETRVGVLKSDVASNPLLVRVIG